MIRPLAGAGLGAAAVLHAGPALAPVLPGVGPALGLRHRLDGAAEIALTFDDGPHPQGTERTLEALRAAGVAATFFLVGEQVEQHRAIAAEIVAAGHGVGLHCHRHRNLLRLGPGQIRADLERARALIEEATERPIALHRPPYGIYSGAGLAVVRSRGWEPVLWSRWGRDWAGDATPESIARLCTRGPEGRRDPPAARRRSLQRPGLMEAHRGGAAADHRRDRPQGSDDRAARWRPA